MVSGFCSDQNGVVLWSMDQKDYSREILKSIEGLQIFICNIWSNSVWLMQISRVWPHFAAEIRIGIVSVLERFQAFPTLQNLTRDTSCTSPGIAKDRKLISIFIFVNQAPISIDVTNVKTSLTGMMSIQMKIPKKQRIWSKYWFHSWKFSGWSKFNGRCKSDTICIIK